MKNIFSFQIFFSLPYFFKVLRLFLFLQAPREYVQEYELQELSDGLSVSSLGLNFKLSQSDFINGELKLKVG